MNETTQAEICKAITENSNIRNKRILEVGCGSGRITSHLVKHTLNITAIDPCTASIRSAQNSYPQIEFLVGSGEKTEFKDSTFDAVIFSLSLHHQNPVLALKEAQRVIKPTGNIIIIEPVIGGQFENVCVHMDNENLAKESAQEAVLNSGMRMPVSKIFGSVWEFDCKEELYAWLADYYEKPVDTEAKANIEKTLSACIDDKPLSLESMNRIQILAN